MQSPAMINQKKKETLCRKSTGVLTVSPTLAGNDKCQYIPVPLTDGEFICGCRPCIGKYPSLDTALYPKC